MLKIDNITFYYPRRKSPVIDGFSLEMKPGGIYGLLGRNGAGKSTLLYLICGLLTPKHGEVNYKGVNTRLRRTSTLNDIFIVPEEFTLPPHKPEELCGDKLEVLSQIFAKGSGGSSGQVRHAA